MDKHQQERAAAAARVRLAYLRAGGRLPQDPAASHGLAVRRAFQWGLLQGSGVVPMSARRPTVTDDDAPSGVPLDTDLAALNRKARRALANRP